MRITAPMLAHQARLAGRSALRIVREPDTARELPRLIRTRGRSTVSLRAPWLPFRLIDELSERIGPESRVFEYGGGGSTLWFLDRGTEVVTAEHDAEWSRTLATMTQSRRWTLLERSSAASYRDYVEAITDYPDECFDLVVVDGRERVRCARAAMTKVAPGGWLVFDDIDRPRYEVGLETIGWPRRDVVGFAPAKPTLAYTAVFTRPLVDD